MSEDTVLKALSEHTQAAQALAEEERKRREVEQERLIVEQKRLREEQRKTQVLWAIFDRYTNLAEQVTGQVHLVNTLIEAVNHLFAFSEWFEELADRFESIETNQRLSLELQRLSAPRMRNGGKEKLEQIIREMDNGPQIISLKRQLSTLHRRLAKLKEQRALAGAGADPRVEIEIENIQEEISEVEDQLRALTEE